MCHVLILSPPSSPALDLQALAGAGHPSRQFATVAEARAYLERATADVALIDHSFYTPRLTGELQASCEDLVCLLLLSQEAMGAATQALSNGITDFLIHPVEPTVLRLRVEMAAQLRRRQQDASLYEMTLEDRVVTRTQELWEKKEALKRQFLHTIEALEVALEAKHEYTEGHSRRVAAVSVQIALELSLPPREVERIRLAALFHDIGKIGIRDNVLNKPGPLTDEELEHIKTHPLIAEKILGPLDGFGDIIDMIKYEHERFDGKGYPYKLARESIPLGARIIAVADAYDALVTTRSYRPGTTDEVAIAEIRRCSGAQFDSGAVDALARVLARKTRPTQAPIG